MADSQLLKNLNETQKQAVTHQDGPLLIVAGAGTGKTTVITSKIAWLIMEKGIKPEEILALTFTEKAAAEMEERVDRLLPLGYADLWISTFHSFAERILKEHALEIGLPDNFKLLSTSEQWLLVRKNLDKFNLDYYRPLGNPTKFIHALIKLFSRAKDEEIYPEDYLKYAEDLKLNSDSAEFIKTFLTPEEIKKLPKAQAKELLAEEILKQQEIADAYHTYQKLLLDSNSLDFGDLINYVLKLFKTRKNLLIKYRSQFKYILVDEFQDTNWAQYELVKLLAAPKNNLTVVGDDDQSIYKFRGASISNIMQFKDDFPKAKSLVLTDNYRSCQNILDLAYNFIQLNNPNRLEIKLSAGKNKLSKKLLSHKDEVGAIKHLHGQSLLDEVELVVNKIIELYNSDKENSWGDFAVLVRANAGADEFLQAMDLAKVPYLFLASRGLYKESVVLDVLSWFRCLDDYHESRALYRILTFPVWQIPHEDIINLNYWANRKGWSLFEVCRQNVLFQNISSGTRDKIKVILSLLEKQTAAAKANKKASWLLTEFFNTSGYLKQLTIIDSLANREQLNRLNQFYKKIQEFEKDNADSNLNDFMGLLELELESGEEGSLVQNLEESGPDTVKVMTIHASKGLEFKYVFIVNLVDKKFPTISKSDPIELPASLVKEIIPEGDIHLEEERRLFYVAMTRAKIGLFFSSAVDYGGARGKKLSRFLVELSDVGLTLSENALIEAKAIETGLAEGKFIKHPQPLAEYKKQLIPKQFSFTQLRAFDTCPYQYRFSHILKIPVAGKPQFSFGKTMHSAMQKFFLLARSRSGLGQADLFGGQTAKQPIVWEEVKKIYEDSFIDDWYPDQETKKKYYQKGLESMKKFFSDWQANPILAEDLERGFTFKLDKDHSLRGAIDRIDKLNDGVRLVDYKTGTPKDKLNSDDKEQLLIYQMAASESLGLTVKELVFYYFDNNQEVSFLGSDKDLEKLRDKISKTIDEINKGEFPAKPEKEKCKWCDFKNICDFVA